jgi:hypothetical protein
MAWSPIPYELRIGVTGHRDFKQPEAVEAAIRSLLGTIVQVLDGAAKEPLGQYGSPPSPANRIDRALAHGLALWTRVAGLVWRRWPRVSVSPRRPPDSQQTPLKLTVITSLARGADQIVAHVVCEMVKQMPQPTPRERYVEAVLPFGVEVYEQEFEEPDLSRFRNFLELDCGRTRTHSKRTIVDAVFPGTLSPTDQGYTQAREAAFEAAGQRVVDTSEIVIAIWDPAHPEHRGGTAGTVRYALNAGRLVVWLNPARLEAGPAVLRSLNPAATDANTPDPSSRPDVPKDCRSEPLPTRAKAISRNFHRLAAFNRDGAVDESRLQSDFDEERDTLLNAARESGLPSAALSTLLNALLPIVVRADHLAVQYRGLRQFSAQVWPFAAALVVSMMAIQIIFADALYWLAFVELAVLVLGYVSYRVSLSDDWHGKWLNDRRLAEALRSSMYAALVRGPAPAANPLPFYDPANAWFIASVKRIIAKERRQFEHALPLKSPEVRRAIVAFLKRAWVLDQAAYHHGQAERLKQAARSSKDIRFAMIVLLAGVALIHGVGFGHGVHATVSWDRIDLWIGVATVALPAWAAAFHVASSLDDHERLAERSAQMASLLDGLARQLDNADTVDELVQRVEEAERIMDLESAEWAESLMDRRPEFTG